MEEYRDIKHVSKYFVWDNDFNTYVRTEETTKVFENVLEEIKRYHKFVEDLEMIVEYHNKRKRFWEKTWYVGEPMYWNNYITIMESSLFGNNPPKEFEHVFLRKPDCFV